MSSFSVSACVCVCICVYMGGGGGNFLLCFCPMFCTICVSSLGYLSKPSSKAIWFDTNEIRIQIMFINHSLITIEVRSKSNGSRTPTTTNKKWASAPTHTHKQPHKHTVQDMAQSKGSTNGKQKHYVALIPSRARMVSVFCFPLFFTIMHEKL